MKYYPKSLEVFLLSIPLWLSGCSGGASDSRAPGPERITREVIVAQANFPVSLAQAPDLRLFYSELSTGSVRVIENGLLRETPVATLEVPGTGNEGLLGLALDPDFSNNFYLYAYYTAQNPTRNRLVRFTLVDNLARDPKVLLDNLPFGGHDGGRLVFGLDSSLFISIGDAGNPELAQDPKSFAGKILRISRDGKIPKNNPDPASPIFASGLRNAFGLSVDPRNGILYASDNGPNCDDELNQVLAGANLGWRSKQPCADSDPRFTLPLLTFNPPIAPTGISFYSGNRFSNLQNKLLLADFLNGDLHSFEIDSSTGSILGMDQIIEGFGKPIIDVYAGKDGFIYIATTNTIERLVPSAD